MENYSRGNWRRLAPGSFGAKAIVFIILQNYIRNISILVRPYNYSESQQTNGALQDYVARRFPSTKRDLLPCVNCHDNLGGNVRLDVGGHD
jgi:hypothetical protein